MNKFASVVLFALVAACGSSSRVDECEVTDCDQAVIDTCVAAVEACEAGGLLVDTCVDAAILANDLSCGLDPVDTGA
ncbi:MAG: hypothetical protein AAF602_24350 [Myxococcota bacterium]